MLLLKNLENLTHNDRVREMIELGRREKDDLAVVSFIDDLQKGNHYERLLGLYSCHGSYNAERVLTAIADNSRTIRCMALDLISLVGSDEQIIQALESINLKERILLLNYSRRRQRLTPIDEFLNTLSAREEINIDTLLIYGSPELVTHNLDRILERDSTSEWERLARFHPDITISILKKYAETAGAKDSRFVFIFNNLINIIIELRPQASLNLIENLATHPCFAQLYFQNLVYYYPVEISRLIINYSNRNIDLNNVAHKLPLELLQDLITNKNHAVSYYSQWLPKLKPQERAIIYESHGRGWRDRHGCLSIDIIQLLPRAIREKEARYHLQLPRLATRPRERLPYAALLPPDEARDIVEPYLNNPDAALRILALTSLIKATRYHRSRLSDLLKIIRERRNEQDPVRCAMLEGLAALPPGIWKEEYLTALGEILSAAIEAADLSEGTTGEAQRIVIRILPFHPQWSAQWLFKFVAARGRMNFYNLGGSLDDRSVGRIAPLLLPVFRSWAAIEKELNVIAAANSFGKRLEVFDGLVELLEQILRETRHQWIAEGILGIFNQYRRDRLPDLIPRLLTQDRSWFTLSVVNQYIHRQRQDLLTPFLGQTAYEGKYSTGKTRFVPYFTGGFFRWTLQQQIIYAGCLEELTKDQERDIPSIWNAIEGISLLPAIEPTRLFELASRDNPHSAIRDRAIRALSRLDDGRGVPFLLRALEDERARIAIYALRRCLMEMPPDRALSILKEVNSEKVTVAKEIVRLLGDLKSESAYLELLAWNERDLHRDVSIALLRGLWEFLEKGKTWEVLEDYADKGDVAIASMVGRTPVDRLSATTKIRWLGLLARLLNRPEPELRLDVLQNLRRSPITDGEAILLPSLLKGFNSPYIDEVEAAAALVFSNYAATNSIIDGIKNILLNRRNLQIIVASLQGLGNCYQKEYLPLVRATLSLLESDIMTVSLRVELAVAAIPWRELAGFFTELNNRGELHADALNTAIMAINKFFNQWWGDGQGMRELEDALAVSEDEKLRRIALAALITRTESRSGWDREAVRRLLRYRQDRSPLVAGKALFTFPPDGIMAEVIEP